MSLELASEISKSDLLPKHFQSVGNTYLLIDASEKLGCSILELANNCYLKNGKLCYGAAFLIGLANKSQLIDGIKYNVEEVKNDVIVTAYTNKNEGRIQSSVKLSTALDQWNNDLYKSKDLAIHCLKLRAANWLIRTYLPEITAMTTKEEQEDITPKTTNKFVTNFNKNIME